MPTGLHLPHQILLFYQKSLQVARAHKRLSYLRVQVMNYRSITSSLVLYLRVGVFFVTEFNIYYF